MVDPAYQNKDYTSKLIQEIFNFSEKNVYSLELSSYYTEGEKKLEKVFKRCAEESSVQVVYG